MTFVEFGDVEALDFPFKKSTFIPICGVGAEEM
jgi:hypothetical protein